MTPIEFNAIADVVISVLEKSIEHLKTAKSAISGSPSEAATAEFHFNAAIRQIEDVVHAVKTGRRA